MAFVVVHRATRAKGERGESILRAGRRMTERLSGRRSQTRQQRVDQYVSRMPIAVITASLGGHPALRSARQR